MQFGAHDVLYASLGVGGLMQFGRALDYAGLSAYATPRGKGFMQTFDQ